MKTIKFLSVLVVLLEVVLASIPEMGIQRALANSRDLDRLPVIAKAIYKRSFHTNHSPVVPQQQGSYHC